MFRGAGRFPERRAETYGKFREACWGFPEWRGAFSRLPVLAVIPRIGAPSTDRRRLWLAAAPIALGLVLVVLASYHIASGNDQLAFLFSRGAP